jgi:hypothetical protein
MIALRTRRRAGEFRLPARTQVSVADRFPADPDFPRIPRMVGRQGALENHIIRLRREPPGADSEGTVGCPALLGDAL